MNSAQRLEKLFAGYDPAAWNPGPFMRLKNGDELMFVGGAFILSAGQTNRVFYPRMDSEALADALDSSDGEVVLAALRTISRAMLVESYRKDCRYRLLEAQARVLEVQLALEGYPDWRRQVYAQLPLEVIPKEVWEGSHASGEIPLGPFCLRIADAIVYSNVDAVWPLELYNANKTTEIRSWEEANRLLRASLIDVQNGFVETLVHQTQKHWIYQHAEDLDFIMFCLDLLDYFSDTKEVG